VAIKARGSEAELFALEDHLDDFLPSATAASDRELIAVDQHGVLERQGRCPAHEPSGVRRESQTATTPAAWVCAGALLDCRFAPF
jgi:hypothetical protein